MWCSLFLWNINTGSLAHWLSIVSVVNMVDWSIISVLDPSVAHGHSHELVALVVLALDGIWELELSLKEFVDVVSSNGRNNVGDGDLLLNSAEVSVHVHRCLSDRDHCFHHVPQDSLDERRGGERSLVGESSVEVNKLDKLAHIEWIGLKVLHLWSPIGVEFGLPLVLKILHEHLSMLLLIDQILEELIVVKNIWVLDLSLVEIVIWHDLEHEAEDSCEELGGVRVISTNLVRTDLVINEIDNMHLEIHKFSVN